MADPLNFVCPFCRVPPSINDSSTTQTKLRALPGNVGVGSSDRSDASTEEENAKLSPRLEQEEEQEASRPSAVVRVRFHIIRNARI